MKIDGIFRKYVYRNEKDGYSGFYIADKEKNIFCKGFIQTLIFETPLSLEGEFETDEFGREAFSFTSYNLSDSDAFFEEKFLNGLNIPGFTPKNVKILMEWFNYGVISTVLSCKTSKAFVDRCPDKLKPIAKKIYLRINNVDKTKELFDLIVKAGGNYNNVRKLISVNKSSEDALKKLMKNPYSVGIRCGLKFSSCDKLAEINGLTAMSHNRVKGLLMYCLKKGEDDGNTYLTIEELKSRCDFEQKKAVFEKIPFQYILSESMVNSNVVFDNGRIYRKKTKLIEDGIVNSCNRIIRSSTKLDTKFEIIDELERSENIKLSESQKNAISALKTTGLKVITGGPGSGKTTLMNIIIKYCQKAFPEKKIALCAPTGCAAQNLGEKTKNVAETIHKMLNVLPYGEDDTVVLRAKKREEAIFIIDESSMLDLAITNVLLNQIPNDALVIFIGDINQLPSIQAGDILNNFIKGGIETYYLEGSFRQADESPIIYYANNIKDGVLFKEEDGSDGFSIITAETDEDILEICKAFAYKRNEYQILSPGKKHLCGTRNINNELQKQYLEQQPSCSEKKQFGMNSFYIGDTIIFTRNNYADGYYNGKIGKITDIFDEGIDVVFENGRTLAVDNKNLEDISLAYAMTVHKSQGGEYDNVIIVLDPKFLSIMNKNLLYTAVTRAKKSVTILTPDINFINSVIKKAPPKRNSAIAEKLRIKKFTEN